MGSHRREKIVPFASLAVLAAAMITTGVFVTTWDMGQLHPSVQALLNGDFGGVYPEDTIATSLPAWLLIVAGPYAAFRHWLPPQVAWPAAGILVAFPLLYASVLYAAKTLHPQRPRYVSWVLAAASVLLPTTLAAFFEYYHPQDVAATAFVVLALTFTRERRWLAAAVLFALAVLTRQWAVLPLLVSLPFLGRDLLRFCGVVAGVGAAVCVPFLVAGNPGFFDAAAGSQVAYRTQTPVGLFLYELTNTTTVIGQDQGFTFPLFLVRSLPIICAVGITAALFLKKQISPSLLLPVAAIVLISRTLVESVPYVYYWAPAIVILLLLTTRARAALAAAFAIGAALTVFAVSLNDIPVFIAVGVWLAINAAALYVTWALRDDPPPPDVDTAESPPPDVAAALKRTHLVFAAAAALAVYVFSAQYFNPDPGDVDPTRELDAPAILQLSPEDIGINTSP